jgi:hypothetical protein
LIFSLFYSVQYLSVSSCFFSVTPESSFIQKLFIDHWIQGFDGCSKISIASSYSLLTNVYKSECEITEQGEEFEQEIEEFEQKELEYYKPEANEPERKEAKLEEQDPLGENRAANEGCRVVVRCVKCHQGEWFLLSPDMNRF